MNDFLSLAATRFAVRKFKPDAIAPETLNKIIEAGRLAPTAGNYQAVHVYVIESEEARAKVKALTKFTFNAPVVLLFCYEADRTWKNPLQTGVTSGEQDASIVATHIMLEAWEEGVGSCWVGYFPPDALASALALPEAHKPVLLMPMGYPAEDAKPSPMHEKSRNTDELVSRL